MAPLSPQSPPFSDGGRASSQPRHTARFILLSALGIFTFLVPVPYHGRSVIPVGLLVDLMAEVAAVQLPWVLVSVCVFTALASVAYSWLRLSWLPEMGAGLFDTSGFWVTARLLGAVFGVMYNLQWGPAMILGKDTGGAAFVDIGEQMLLTTTASCLFLPALTAYGCMEFVGTLARPLFIRLFRLPGRSAIDALASFVAAATVGLLITIEQYRNGVYSTRQAAVVATNFSVVSIPFALLVSRVSEIDHLFFQWYAAVVVACIICAIITPRLPPLSRKPDTYFEGAIPRAEEEPASGRSLWGEALRQATQRASEAPGATGYLVSSSRAMAEVVLGVVGASMGLVVVAMILAHHTSLFAWLSLPLVPLLNVLGFAQSEQAAPALILGFLDMFLPAVIAKDLSEEWARFVLAGLSICQLVYLSEVGVLILRSILPLSFSDLMLIFALRTAICLPVLVVLGRLIVSW